MSPPLSHPGNYIGGAFVSPRSPDGELQTVSPADTKDIVALHALSEEHVDFAIESAQHARRPWRRQSPAARRAFLKRYQARLKEHAEPIARTIAREVGKALWDARAEVQAMIGKVDVMLGEGAEYVRDWTLDDGSGEVRHRPLGVLAVIGPFNFPGHLPNGQIVPALLCGNTVVFKPSERAPTVATWMARCFAEAMVPPGVVNVLQGAGDIASALARHDGTDGILFTGSLEVGKRILDASAGRPGRLVALELGGKNASIVLEDADLDLAARQIAFSAYATTGQRCTATARVFVHRSVARPLLTRLKEAALATRVGYPLDEGVFMGPLITKKARERLLAAQQAAVSAGFEPLVPGGAVRIEGREGWYVTPSLHVAPEPDATVPGYTHDELFGPDIAVYIVDDAEQAVELVNATQYGLVAAIFTASRDSFSALADDLEVGVVHFNRSTAGASGRLPFGGIKDSGNHRPAGILTGRLCVAPQSRLFEGVSDKRPPQ